MSEGLPEGRTVIGQSWRRSRLIGVDPGAAISSLPAVDIDRESRLIRAARPVLDQLAGELAGERFGLLLTDARARIVDRRVGLSDVGDALDEISAAPGTLYSEEAVGTNALGTASEIGAPVTVIGDEHFNESLKRFCCFGSPIRDIVTGRTHGVLDICGAASDHDHLFPPYILGAVRQIEARLAEDSGIGSAQLLSEFRRVCARNREPVVALNDEFSLSSRSARMLLGPGDYAVLEDARLRMTERHVEFGVTLGDGTETNVRAALYPAGGVLFVLTPLEGPGCETGAPTPVRRAEIVLVSGELGSGRSATARDVLATTPTFTLDAADVGLQRPGAWMRRLHQAMQTSTATLLLENVHLLPEPEANSVAQMLRAPRDAQVVMTTRSDADLSAAQRLVTALCVEHAVTVPLRQRRHDIPKLVTDILATGGMGNLRVSPEATNMLVGQDWSGNLAELAQVVRTAAGGRRSGTIAPSDLPARYRVVRTGLTRMEQVERDAIVDALQRSGGHRGRAAEDLGISRRTIFNRMKALRISEHELSR